jgi:phthiocerol/phenolphthiocerol synthesis type-I polyketide synthase E
MAQASNRLSDLSPARRKLLARLLEGGHLPAPAPTAAIVESPASAAGRQKIECRQFYDDITARLDGSDVGPFSLFLNFGYVPDASPSHAPVELPEHWINRSSARLVLEVIGRCDLTGRRVLDVGCGRGGTVSVLTAFFRPSSVRGLDLSPAAIAFCRKQHREPQVAFDVGDAEHLPYPGETFDVVINIESSSTYPTVRSFHEEVHRVLVPGGDFLYTDALPVPQFAAATTSLRHTGLKLQVDRDITKNVLRSCDDVAGRRVQAFAGGESSGLDDFLGAPGSHFYEAMKRGEWTYRIQHWKKAA